MYKKFTMGFFFAAMSYGSPICITTIPKCGTHLLMKYIEVLTGKSGKMTWDNWLVPSVDNISNLSAQEYLITHAVCNAANVKIFSNADIRIIFMLRDPRDQIISLAHFIKRRSYWKIDQLSVSEIITQIIQNYSLYYNPSIGLQEDVLLSVNQNSFYQLYLPWQSYEFVYTVKYEDLVGNKGGGSDEKQLQAMCNIASHLHIAVNREDLRQIQNQLYDQTSSTFRTGKIGSWRQEFTKEQKDLFKRVAGDLLIELNYEINHDW